MANEFKKNIFKRKQIFSSDNFLSISYDDLNNIDTLFKNSKNVKSDKYVSAGITLPLGKHRFFIKKYIKRGFFYRFGYVFKKTRIEHNLNVYYLLQEKELSKLCPKIFGFVLKHKFGLLSDSYLVTQYLENMFTQEFFNQLFINKNNSSAFYNGIISTMSSLHNIGIFHGDAKLWNFFQIPDKEYEFGMFDYDGAMIYSKIPIKKRIQDLARLISSIIELNYARKINLYNLEFISLLVSLYEKYSKIKVDQDLVVKKVDESLRKKILIALEKI